MDHLRLYTLDEVAEMLGGHVSQHTIKRLVDQGKIEWSKVGRRRFMTRAQIEALVHHMAQPVRPQNQPAPLAENGFRTTERSRALSNRMRRP